ncbi:MAG: STAS domain-containing protein [Geothrix sp.]|uniref:STAS domain-containing protein n=1 Tax=Geothrix sp. TaxID=1962974 RepID=UPI003BAF4FBF
MEFKTTVESGCATVFLQGRLAFGSYPDFRVATMAALEHPQVDRIQLNMAAVDYLDSSALGMILHFKEKADEARKGLAISSPGPHVAKVLAVVNFSRLIPILP